MHGFTKKTGGMQKHIYLLQMCKKLLVEFIGKFRDCRYHNTPHYATNKSVISEPACQLLEPIKIDFNSMEISHGFYRKKNLHQKPKTITSIP